MARGGGLFRGAVGPTCNCMCVYLCVCLSVFALDASAELAIALQFVRRRDSQSTQSKRLFNSEIVLPFLRDLHDIGQY